MPHYSNPSSGYPITAPSSGCPITASIQWMPHYSTHPVDTPLQHPYSGYPITAPIQWIPHYSTHPVDTRDDIEAFSLHPELQKCFLLASTTRYASNEKKNRRHTRF
ncbi:hypothetical protein Bpfe_000970 [Biomphalaria pfeifferi]|uniref:Uncharacterized protein n=1 Tax=Biomphalaria pfeifferi TaxID=112525 RepID=A0AAD8CBT8_BIOPF|nr:hypothetical protein Bpfe_000970 [Biomphalaria pfeifferi]